MDKQTRGRIVNLVAVVFIAVVLVVGVLNLLSCREREDPTAQGYYLDRIYAKFFTFQDGATAVGNGTALTVAGFGSIDVQVEGISGDTVSFEATIDGSTWYSMEGYNLTDGTKATGSVTADGDYRFPIGGQDQFRVPVEIYHAGTITVKGIAVTHGVETMADTDITTGTVSVAQIENALPTGSNTIGDVTVSDVTTGTVSVAQIENALPAGTNAIGKLAANTGVDIGDVDVTSITTGTVSVAQIENALPTGTNSIGIVDTELPAAAALADAAANPTVPKVGAVQLLYNATAVDANWDRERNNWAEWPFPSAEYTGSSTVNLTNYNARGAYIVVNIAGIGLAQSLTVKASVFDYDGAGTEASDQRETIWSSAALTPTGRHTYLIYPGAGAAAQDVVATVSYPLPRTWTVHAVLNNSEPITFSVGVHYIN